MKTRNAIRIALIMSGKFDLPDAGYTVTGTDQYGNPVTEQIKGIDTARLELEVDRLMAVPSKSQGSSTKSEE
jgi:hypothetical protein